MMHFRCVHTVSNTCAKVIPNNLKGKKVSSQQWLTRQLADPFVEKAKMLNYRCRSAFKLEQINDKVGLLKAGQVIIDCGAAPGSWTQVAVRKCNSNGKLANKHIGTVIGIDKLQIFPIEGAHLIGNMDFTTAVAQERIKTILDSKKVDVVLSDMAPNATGVRSLDQENIIMLCYSVLRFAVQVSKEQASILMKVWDGGEVRQLESDIAKFYNTIKVIKPSASRTDSSEKFLLGRGFKGIES